MSHVLFLTQRMMLGYGVDDVINNLSAALESQGFAVTIACIESDKLFKERTIVQVVPSVKAVKHLADTIKPTIIVAHTSPFFELLPSLKKYYPCFAYEHGDPTPQLFSHDAEERERIKQHKIKICYPNIRGVIAISEFIKRDIEWPKSQVIYHACDHLPKLEHKVAHSHEPLKIGTLMRLGKGEAYYKGGDLFLELHKRIKKAEIPVQFYVMGRGTKADAEVFKEQGFEVFLNATDADKLKYLRDLDVFISCSLWEGFNLPVLEASTLGTLALAFDTGAHPEVTPFTFDHLDDLVEYLKVLTTNRELLFEHSKRGQQFVQKQFASWQTTAKQFCDFTGLTLGSNKIKKPPFLKLSQFGRSYLINQLRRIRNKAKNVTAKLKKRYEKNKKHVS